MSYINQQVTQRTTEVGMEPFYIFRPKIREYSQQFLNDIINKGNIIRTKSGKALYDTVVKDLKERVRLYDELINESINLWEMSQEDFNAGSDSLYIEGMNEWKSEFEETQMGLIKKWEGLIEGAMMYNLDNEDELEKVINSYRDLMIVEDDLSVDDIRRLIKLMRDTYEKQKANKEKELNIFDPSRQTNPEDYYSRFPQEPEKPTGKGLAVRKQQSQRVKVEGEIQKKQPLYVPFGKNIINKFDLNKRVLKLRGPKGGALVGWDTQAISSDLAEVLKQIATGEIVPEYILNKLNDDDKQLLHKIVNKSQLNDKIKTQDINYDRIERDYRRFLLLKGQVLSGNNNKQMIQELKRLIIKLTADGRLPKSQANLSLQELALMEI
jgi:hypothetical protein